MLKTLAVSVALAASLALSSPSAFACDCDAPASPEQSLQQASAVFEGTVVELEEKDHSLLEVTLSVARTWKGVDKDSVKVTTSNGGASCGFDFEHGKTYLVYTYSTDPGPGLATNNCTRTKLSSQASADFEALGEGTKVEPGEPAPGDGGPGDEPAPGDSKAKDDSGCALAPGNAKSSTATGLMLLLAALWFSRRRRA